MSKGCESHYVQCPFYHRQRDTSIVCEGVRAGSTINIVLNNRSARNGYQKDFCHRNWQNCLIAKALMSKYEEADNAEVS